MNLSSLTKFDPAPQDGRADAPRPAADPGAWAPNQLGSTVHIVGEISGRQDMVVDGEVAGNITLPEHTLTIGSKANVKAGIKAKYVVLFGTVEGNIEASDRVELRNCCSLMGDIRSPRVQIENGAYIKGTVEVVRESTAHPVIQPHSSSQLLGQHSLQAPPQPVETLHA